MNQTSEDISKIKAQAVAAAEKLCAGFCGAVRIAFVCCSYDTSFEPVDEQVIQKIQQLTEAYGLNGKVSWSLWVVDDLPVESGFGTAVLKAFDAATERFAVESRLNLVKLKNARSGPDGLKGRALLDGMAAILEKDAGVSAIVYMNLNLKVDAVFSATGLRQVLCDGVDAAIGSRYSGDGGIAVGRGWAGNLKSRIFNVLVRRLLPPIDCYYDTNAPMKVFTPAAADMLVRRAVIPSVSMDCDWLMLLNLNAYKVDRFPVVWEQRSGSRPPWQLIFPCFMDVLKIRRRWKKGLMFSVEEHK